MVITFDPNKDKLNRRKHGVSLAAASGFDPNAQPLTEEELAQFRPWRARLLAPPDSPTITLTMEFDAATIAAFQRQGDDWQQGINAVLREWAIRRGYVPFPK